MATAGSKMAESSHTIAPEAREEYCQETASNCPEALSPSACQVMALASAGTVCQLSKPFQTLQLAARRSGLACRTCRKRHKGTRASHTVLGAPSCPC